MISIDKKILGTIQAARKLPDLHKMVQLAIELEHATIPVYLTSMFSLIPGANDEIRKIIHSVVIEEMLHMCICSNILNALGGQPQINNKHFIPKYPGKLPMGIGDHLIVGLEKFSKDQVKNIFMEIEEPEKPVQYDSSDYIKKNNDVYTIGDFYKAIQKKIIEISEDGLPGNPDNQITGVFSAEDLIPILNKQDALRAIDIIIDQGEGSSVSPIDLDGKLAHYYRFEELYHGRKLVVDKNAIGGFSFSGDIIPFDESGVYNIFPNTTLALLPSHSPERKLANQFSTTYSQLLQALHRSFNGHPKSLDTTFPLMTDLQMKAEKLASTEFPGKKGFMIGPPFEYSG